MHGLIFSRSRELCSVRKLSVGRCCRYPQPSDVVREALIGLIDDMHEWGCRPQKDVSGSVNAFLPIPCS